MQFLRLQKGDPYKPEFLNLFLVNINGTIELVTNWGWKKWYSMPWLGEPFSRCGHLKFQKICQFCWVSKFFDIWNAFFSHTVVQHILKLYITEKYFKSSIQHWKPNLKICYQKRMTSLQKWQNFLHFDLIMTHISKTVHPIMTCYNIFFIPNSWLIQWYHLY